MRNWVEYKHAHHPLHNITKESRGWPQQTLYMYWTTIEQIIKL